MMRIACLILAALVPGAAIADVLLVGNKSADTVWLLDTESGERTAWFDSGAGPHEIEVSPDGRHAVVSNYGRRDEPGDSLTVFDAQTGEVVRVVDLGENTRPHGMAFLGDRRLVVTAEGVARLLVVDIGTGEVLTQIPVGAGTAHMVAVSPDEPLAWVTNIAAGTLERVDLDAGRLTGSIRTGDGAEGVAVARGGEEIWVTNRAEDTVSIVDAVSLDEVATLQSAGVPIRIAITPDGRHALATNARAGTVSVFDVQERELVATIAVAQSGVEYRDTLLGRAALPIGVEVHPDGRRAYVAVSGGDEVAVIDTATWSIIERWETGREPDALGILPAAGE